MNYSWNITRVTVFSKVCWKLHTHTLCLLVYVLERLLERKIGDLGPKDELKNSCEV